MASKRGKQTENKSLQAPEKCAYISIKPENKSIKTHQISRSASLSSPLKERLTPLFSIKTRIQAMLSGIRLRLKITPSAFRFGISVRSAFIIYGKRSRNTVFSVSKLCGLRMPNRAFSRRKPQSNFSKPRSYDA